MLRKHFLNLISVEVVVSKRLVQIQDRNELFWARLLNITKSLSRNVNNITCPHRNNIVMIKYGKGIQW